MTDTDNLDELADAIAKSSPKIRAYAQAQAAATQSQELDIRELLTRVAALEIEPPDPDPDLPPAGDKLRDRPPGYPDYPGFQRISLNGRTYLDLSEDTLLDIGNSSFSEGFELVVRKRCVILGGHVTVTGSSRAAGVAIAIRMPSDASHCYIEGVRIKPTNVLGVWQRTITDGFALRAQKGNLTIQNCLVGPISVKQGYTSADIHPDVFQLQAPADGVSIRAHRLTGYTEYTGIMESEFKVARQDWSHVNLVATGYSATDLDPLDIDPATRGHTAFGMYGAAVATNMPNLTFNEFYWAKDPQQSFAGYEPPELVTQKGAKFGKPAEGDFVTEAALALPYVSPGYV